MVAGRGLRIRGLSRLPERITEACVNVAVHLIQAVLENVQSHTQTCLEQGTCLGRIVHMVWFHLMYSFSDSLCKTSVQKACHWRKSGKVAVPNATRLVVKSIISS
jgi:uncharacterized membrane protein